MEIKAVNLADPQTRLEFIEYPWQIYPSKHLWIPPLKASLMQELSAENLFFRHGKLQAFVCQAGEKILGRVVASIDQNLSDPQVGHFGYFEAENNPQAAQMLLGAAEDWLKSQGKVEIHGPVNLNIYHSYRLQIHGFETPPFLGEPRHPEYYKDLLQSCGYQNLTQWNSWDMPGPILPLMKAQMDQACQSLSATHPIRYTLKYLDFEKFEAEMEKARQVIMQVFSENYGFSHLDQAEFLQVHAALKPILEPTPDLAGIYYQADQPVSFGYAYPDYGPAFQTMNGDISKWKDAFANHPPHTLVFHNFGILAQHRKSHLAYQIYAQGLENVLKKGFAHAIGALAKAGKTAYDKLGAPSRSYAIFHKPLN